MTPGDLVRRVVARLIARPFVSLAVIVAATVAAGWWGMGIPIRTDMEDLFPESTPSVARAREARDRVGSRAELQILVGSPDRDLNRQVAHALGDALAAHDQLVSRVEVHRDISFFRQNALLYLSMDDLADLEARVDAVIQRAVADDFALDGFDDDEDDDAPDEPPATATVDEPVSALPDEDELKRRFGLQAFSEYDESPDGQVIALRVYPTFKPADTERTAELTALVEDEFHRHRARHPTAGLTFATEGDYAQVTAAVDQLGSDLQLATSLALLSLSTIIFLHYRRVRALLLIVLPLAIGLAWTFFFARAAIGYLNLITSFIFAIVTGLGEDYSVHVLSRCDEELQAGKSIDQAILGSLGSLGPAMTTAGLATMASFFCLVFFDFRGFSQFGLIAGVGVLLCIATTFLVLPVFIAAFHRIRPHVPLHAPSDDATPPARPPQRTRSTRRVGAVVLATVGVLLAGAALALPRLEFEADMRKMRAQNTHATSELKKKYHAEADTRAASPALIVTDGLADTQALHRRLAELQPTLPALQDFVSIFTFVPDEQPTKLARVAEVKRKLDMKYALLEGRAKQDADRLRELLTPAGFGVTDLPAWVRDQFTDTRGQLGSFVMLYVKGVKSDAREVLRIADQVGAIEAGGKVHHATAAWFILGDAYTTVREEGPQAVALAAACMLLILVVALRRWSDVALAFGAMAAGFTLFLGLLAAFGLPLNLFNIVVLPTVFGMGLQTAIHLVLRLRAPDHPGLRHVLRSTAVPAGVTALTTGFGFGALIVAHVEGLRSIGWVAFIGIMTCYLATTAIIAGASALGWGRASRPDTTDLGPTRAAA